MNFKKICLVGGLLCGMAVFPACNSTGQPLPPEQRLVLTTQSQVNPETPTEEVALFPMQSLPKQVVQTLGATDTDQTVLTERGNLKAPPPEPKFLPVPEDLTKETWMDVATNPSVWGSVLGALGGGVGAAAPYLGGLEVLLTLFSKRKQQHYAAAGRALAEFNPKEVAINVGKALGAQHSNPS